MATHARTGPVSLRPLLRLIDRHAHTHTPSQTGLDLKVMEDPVGFFNAGVHWATVAWRWGMRTLANLGLHPYPVEGPAAAVVAAAAGSGGGSVAGGGRRGGKSE